MTPLQTAAQHMKDGGIVAYPTEAVFGLGCDPRNTQALNRLVRLKERAHDHQGFILIANRWKAFQAWVKPLPPEVEATMLRSWPGPVTWIVPAKEGLPGDLTGPNQTLAIRVTAHHIAKNLSLAFGGPIVSTSANRHGLPPEKTYSGALNTFQHLIDFVMPGCIGNAIRPSTIKDALTGQVLRGA